MVDRLWLTYTAVNDCETSTWVSSSWQHHTVGCPCRGQPVCSANMQWDASIFSPSPGLGRICRCSGLFISSEPWNAVHYTRLTVLISFPSSIFYFVAVSINKNPVLFSLFSSICSLYKPHPSTWTPLSLQIDVTEDKLRKTDWKNENESWSIHMFAGCQSV